LGKKQEKDGDDITDMQMIHTDKKLKEEGNVSNVRFSALYRWGIKAQKFQPTTKLKLKNK
jgi:hypothetical protein